MALTPSHPCTAGSTCLRVRTSPPASAQVADTVKAALGANADVELSLAAAFPLNFFSQAGVIADVEAAIAATGSLDLEVDLPIATLIDRVTADACTGAWADLAKIVCQQLQVSAGYWAMVGLEVQARAQALLVGSFLPQADGSTPGFTFHCEYGYGYWFGAGSRLVTNVGIVDSAALFNQLSGRAATILDQQLAALVGSLSGQAATDAQAALPFAQMVVPIAVRAAFVLGPRSSPAQTRARRNDRWLGPPSPSFSPG